MFVFSLKPFNKQNLRKCFLRIHLKVSTVNSLTNISIITTLWITSLNGHSPGLLFIDIIITKSASLRSRYGFRRLCSTETVLYPTFMNGLRERAYSSPLPKAFASLRTLLILRSLFLESRIWLGVRTSKSRWKSEMAHNDLLFIILSVLYNNVHRVSSFNTWLLHMVLNIRLVDLTILSTQPPRWLN